MDKGYTKSLDDFFCDKFSDYTRISAIPGYEMPELVTIGKDGNIYRRDSSLMSLKNQPKCEELLNIFKAGLVDTDFTFHFKFIPFFERIRNIFNKYTFAKVLPIILSHVEERVEDLGDKLEIEPYIWQRIVKGKLYPEKNTVIAIALVCRLNMTDTNDLFRTLGYKFSTENVRDIVVEYLITQSVHNEIMRDTCLAEYKIENLPIKRKKSETEN